MQMFIVALLKIAKKWLKQPKCPSTDAFKNKL